MTPIDFKTGRENTEAAERAETDQATLLAERDRRRADAFWAVWRAKGDDGRAAEPPTAHDASVAYAIAMMLDSVAGRAAGMDRNSGRPAAVAAGSAAESGRVLARVVEQALTSGATSVVIDPLVIDPLGLNRGEEE